MGCYQLYQRWNSGPGGLPGSLQCARASAQSADNQGQQDCSSHPGCNIQYFTGIIKLGSSKLKPIKMLELMVCGIDFNLAENADIF